LKKIREKVREKVMSVLLEDMNARKSLTTAAISTVAMFSLFGANIAQAAPGGNGNGRNESIDLGPAPVQLHNDRAEVKNDCPSDDAWWHFVLAPNNGQYEFSSMNLNIGGSATLISSSDIVPNSGQTDNVFVAVPAGAELNDLTAAGSSAMVAPYSMNVKFVLSHVCEGGEIIDDEPVTEEETPVNDEVIDDEPVSDEEVTEDEIVEEEAIEDEPAEEVITEIVTPTPNSNDIEELVESNEPAIDNEPTIKTVDEAPAIEEVAETAAPSLEEAAEVAANTKEAPSAEVAPEAAVAADDTDHNALPATGMELSLAFLGLGLAGLGGRSSPHAGA
jgi:hypothetical protein